jgi:hypothetical protein
MRFDDISQKKFHVEHSCHHFIPSKTLLTIFAALDELHAF